MMLDRLPFSTKIGALTLSGLVLLTAALLAAPILLVVDHLEQQAIERQEINMRIAWEVLRSQGGTTFRIAEGRLLAGDRVLNGDNTIVDRVRQLVGGTATIFMGDTRIATNVIASDGTRAIGTQLARGPVYDAVLRDGRSYRGEAQILGETFLTAYDPIKDTDGRVIGVLYVGLKKSALFAVVRRLVTTIVLIGLGMAVVTAGAVSVAGRRLMRPFVALRDAMERLARGDVAVAVPAADRQDEIGTMARAVLVLKDQATEWHGLADEQARERREREVRVERLTTLIGSFQEEMAESLRLIGGAVASLESAAGTLAAATGETSDRSAGVAAAADDATANVCSTAATAERLNSTIMKVAQHVESSRTVAGRGMAEAADARKLIGGLTEAGQRIGEVVKMIQGISEQTNLLALNATIEAARVGAAGKGFAVVASEVKALASQTGRATEGISRQIEEMQNTIDRSAQSLGRIADVILQINQASATVADAVEQQTEATTEIGRSAAAASHSTTEVSGSIAVVRDTAKHASDEAQQVLEAVRDLNQQSAAVRRKVDDFIAAIRAV